MAKKWFLIILILSFLLGGFNFVFAQADPIKNDISNGAKKIQIDFFYSAICPHCKIEKEFLKTLKKKYPEIEIKEYEVFYNHRKIRKF